MTGSIALDVVIGLLFIYLLYSLLATIIFEFISEIIGIRTRVFEYYLKLMLTDHDKFSFRNQANWFYSKPKDFRTEFLNQPSIKNLTKHRRKNSLIKSGPSYLSSQTFSEGLIDLLVSEGNGDNELKRIESGIKVWKEKTDGVKLEEKTSKQLERLMQKANGDVDRFKIALEDWFNATMERCAGGFKQITQQCLIIIGLFVAISFNVNSIYIAQKLATNSTAREQISIMAENVSKRELEEIKLNAKENLENANEVLGLGWKDPCDISWKNFIGWLITAFAISLGSPFWFDLLNKFMRLRTSIPAATSTNGEQNKEQQKDIKG